MTRPVRCQPHPIFLPRSGAPFIRLSTVVGWHLERREPATYIIGARPAPKEEPITEPELADWRQRHGATCSNRVALLLAQLERDFGHRPVANP